MSSNEVPKSSISGNSYKDFIKILRAYYDELMHISKEESPSLSKEDILVVEDLIKEVLDYSSFLLQESFTNEAKQIVNLGLVISDFLLKIFGKLIGKTEDNITQKLKFPLGLKLLLLEANFNILFKYDKDYVYSEKNLEEIYEIQNFLKLPKFNIACLKFYMSIVKFYLNDFDSSEKLALEAQKMLEIKENTEQDNKRTRKISNILQFLAELYGIKKDYKKVVNCYENAYYLNLGKYGNEHVNTLFFKTKLEIAQEEMKKAECYPQVLNYSNLNSQSYQGYNNQSLNKMGDIPLNIIHKGSTPSFSFRIPTSSLHDPLLISLYNPLSEEDKDKDKFSPSLLVGTLFLDKARLSKLIGKGNANAFFYSDRSLEIILENIELDYGKVLIRSRELAESIICSSVKVKVVL